MSADHNSIINSITFKMDFQLTRIAKEGETTYDGKKVEGQNGQLWWAVPVGWLDYPPVLVCLDQYQKPTNTPH